MSPREFFPLLLVLAIAALLGLVAWGFYRARRPLVGDSKAAGRDGYLIALLVLAVLVIGLFMAFVLVRP